MELNEYIEKGGQRLRLGYTTGSCAAAAAKAAALMLLTGQRVSQVELKTPKGLDLILEIEDICFWKEQNGQNTGSNTGPDAGSCAVRKDSGDDPDITNHALIYARVSRSDLPGIRIDGGEGVGRVTKPGLDQPVGSAAINSTPRRMIREAVQEVLELFKSGQGESPFQRTGPEDPAADQWKDCMQGIPRGLDITISVPQGKELAAKTFNPKLGIEGGISILGTSGIVEPMSDQALLDTIRVEIRVRKEEGLTILPAAPGNYGKNFFLEKYGFSLDTAVTASNFIYDTVKMAADAGFTKMLFVGHIGKLVKVAGGIRNTHSQYGDHRMEILTEIAESILLNDEKGQKSDKDGTIPAKSLESVRRREELAGSLRTALADCVMTDEAIRILKGYGIAEEVLREMTRRIQAVMQEWAQGKMQVEVVVFSNVHGELGRTDNAPEYMRILQEQISE
jgi:cobalt-precorrin-5B (C1)-methyltransferase